MQDCGGQDIRWTTPLRLPIIKGHWILGQIFRGSVTFPIRMERINQSALKIAKWLVKRENVTFVFYPGLESNSGHKLTKKQMGHGFGGVISFGLNTDDKTVEHFCAALKVVTFAVSLGHDESLIFPQPSNE